MQEMVQLSIACSFCVVKKTKTSPSFYSPTSTLILSARFAIKDFTKISSLLVISELLIPCFLCFSVLLGVHTEAGGSRAGFVSHLPDPEDPHGPQTVPRLHAPGRPPPTALIPSKCY